MKNRKAPEKSRDPVNTARRLYRYLGGKYRLPFLLAVGCIIIATLASVSVSLSLRTLIDGYLLPMSKEVSPDYGPFYKMIGIMGGIFLSGVAATYVKARMMVIVGQGVLKKIRDEMFQKLQTLPIRFFDEHSHGTVMSLFTNDTDTLRQMINQSVPQLIQSGLTIAVTFISMVVLSPMLTVLALVMLFVMSRASKFLIGKSGKYFGEQQKALGEVMGYVEERMTGQKVVKVFNREEASKEEFDKVNERLFQSAARAHGYANLTGPVIGNIGNLTFVLTAVAGGILAVKGMGGLTFGVLASYLQLTKSFTQPMMQVGQQFNTIVMALAGAERIFDMLDEKSDIDEGTITLVNVKKRDPLEETEEFTGRWAWKKEEEGEVTYVELKGDVRFMDMTFGYNKEEPVLEGLSLYAKPGQKLAFVGSTGAGKTTVMNLVNRFYDVDGGRILYDGIDVRDIKKADLRRSLGVVLQETHLFTGTIADNIRFGKPDATEEEVRSAAKLAYADTFIERLPEGYDTLLTGDGEELSQGQRQLLSIARAAVANCPVLILDEATSSIDTRTESIVQQGMDNLMKGRTVFVIAHRLSTIRNSDAIIVLEHGKIIERGDHEDLLEQRGKYYELYTGGEELE